MSFSQFSPLPRQDGKESIPQGKAFSNFSSALPIPEPEDSSSWFPPLVVFPSVPAPSGEKKRQFSGSFVPPISELPMVSAQFGSKEYLKVLPEIVLPPEKEISGTKEEKLRDIAVAQAELDGEHAGPVEEADFTDEELAAALAPIFQNNKQRPDDSYRSSEIDRFLEPLLRATVRRALAEYSPATRPFQAPGFIDRTVWRLQALFSSRTFEDVLFEKTNRFHVEEVYLLDAASLALVSFASCDPARHSTAKRIEGSAKRIAMQIRNDQGEIRRSFEQADGRNVISETGSYLILSAIVRGRPNEMVLADIEFSLRRIEDHFRERFEQTGSALMHALQPYLEDCLLIQSPASAA